MNYFDFLSLDAHDALLKRRSSLAASVEEDRQMSPAAPAKMNFINDDENDWDVWSTFGFSNIKETGAKRLLRHFQNSFRGKKRKVPRSAAE